MADRTVTVSLVAQVNGYISGMQKAAAETRNLGSESEKLAKQKEAFNQVGIGAVALGAALAVGLGAAVKAAADFDAQMSQVQTLSHATATQMGALREAALTMGQGIGFSATQVADAETELVKAGVSVKDQLGGALVGALNLAAAGQLDVASATEIAASAMTQFKLKGQDVPHIADLLAAGADKALGSVQDLGEALKYVGPVSQSLGVSIEQTTGTLALFAQNGILGEQAGTSLRGVLLSLTAPSQAASDVMQEYGINLFNAQGKFIGVNGAAQQLKDKLSPLDQATRTAALGQIFGNAQITAANVLYEGGAKSVDKWTKAVNDNGFAAEQAAGKMDNLNGDLSKLKAAFETGLIETGESANSSLRGIVQSVTGVVQSFNGMSEGAKTATFVIGAVAAAIALAGGGFLIAVPKIAAFKLALDTMGVSGKGATKAIGGITAGLAAAGVIISIYANQQAKIANNAAALTDTLNTQTGALTKNSRAYVIQQLNNDNVFKAAKQAGIGQKELTDAVIRGGDALDKVNEKFGKTNSLGHVFDGQAYGSTQAQGAIKSLSESLDRSKEAFKNAKAANEDHAKSEEKSAPSSDTNATAISGVAQASDDAAQAVSDLANKLKGLTSNQLDVNSTQRDFEAAIDAVTDSIKDNGQSLDVTTDAGRKNSAALDTIAQSALSYSAAIYQQTGNQDQATAALESGRASLVSALGQYGITGQAAQDYADKILGTPTQWATTFQANTDDANANIDGTNQKIKDTPAEKRIKLAADADAAKANLDDLTKKANNVPPYKKVQALADVLDAQLKLGDIQTRLNNLHDKTVTVSTRSIASVATGALPFADGGAVYGPGSATSDSVNARLSNGEHVLTARDVSLLGGQAGVYAFRASLEGGVRKFAEGGAVTPTYVQAPPQVIYANAGQGPSSSRSNTYNLYSLDPEPYAQAVIRRENLGFV